jgi:3-hydroxyacyl-CoA dehydrogenase/enoyl-CoA hydratase/3-hydroxybutyryl-CoA epimerase
MTLFQTANLRVEVGAPSPYRSEEGCVATLWLDVAGRSVNVFHRELIANLDTAFDRIAEEKSINHLVIRSAKPAGFLAGADLNEFTAVRDEAAAVALSERGQRLFDKLARLRQPTAALIHGACLGGGLEFALACDYRWVVDTPKTQLGLPELELGLLPGWGGTQRLPRVIGLERALRMILGSRRLNAAQAVAEGLAEVAIPAAKLEEELEGLIDTLRLAGRKETRHRVPLRTWRQRFVESNPLGRALIWRGTERTLRQRVPEDMPAPWDALQAVRVGITSGMEAGLAYERQAIGRLALTPACHNLVNLFFQRDKTKKLPAELKADLVRPINSVGIVGAGTMGAGIAQLAALKGMEVVVREVNDAALTAGMKRIEDLLEKAAEKGVLSRAEAGLKFGAIRQTTSWDGFGHVDLVVEAVIEDIELKRSVFRDLELLARPTTILATNTSSLLVEKLQEDRNYPERIAGLHFFNPVHKMPLIEVVRGPATDAATIATLTHWAIDLGKMPVVVKDSPGFLVNRILMPYLNEAVVLLRFPPSIGTIDRVMRRFGMPMGPLELLDHVGLDVAAHIEQVLRPLKGERFPANTLFERLVKQGCLGVKSGEGFYSYQGSRKLDSERVSPLLGTSEPQGNLADFRDRMVLLMVNEAAACLGEGIVAEAQTIDTAMVFGTGWAPHRGGPLHYADTLGISAVVVKLDELKAKHGPRFEPCAELRRRAKSGEPFYKPFAELAPTP